MTEPRDTLVGDALRRLGVPDHAPDFWDRLDADLADRSDVVIDPDGGAEPDGGDLIELGTAREARRSQPWSSRRVPAVAAAVGAAVALALGVGLPAVQQAADGDAQVDMADGTDDPAPDAMQPAPETDGTPMETTTTTEPDPALTQLAAEELAGEWLTRLRAGEVDAAYELLDDASRDALSVEAFRADATALAEGAGAFAGDGTTSTVVLLERGDDPPLRVVTFTGEVQRAGLIEFASYPVAITGRGDGDLGIRFTRTGPTLEVDTEVMSGTTLSSPLPLVVSASAELWVSYDGRTPEPLDQAGEASIELDVTVAGGGGTHIVTLMALDGEDITVRAYPVMLP